MGRTAPLEETVRTAFGLLDSGASPADVGEVCGVSAGAIRNWMKRYGYTPNQPARAAGTIVAAPVLAPDVEDVDDEPEPEGLSPLEHTIALQRKFESLAKRSEAVGNMRAAGMAMRDAANLSNTIARLRKMEQLEADVLRISRADIASAEDSLKEKVHRYLDRPLLCAECGRKLSIKWAEEDNDPNA